MGKKILLFSGGLDSTLLEWVVKPDILLYVNLHTSYSEREVEHLQTLSPYYKDRLVIKDLPMGEYEKADKFFPYRNLLLTLVALQYAPKVYLGFTYQDNCFDCKEPFIKKATAVLNYLNLDCENFLDWSADDFSLEAPFRYLTKSEMVAQCLRKGMPAEQIQTIRTCYNSESKIGCGSCNPCWNKAVALINNGIYTDGLFDHELDMSIFDKSFSFYEKNWGRNKNSCKHYKEVVNAYTLLRQAGK